MARRDVRPASSSPTRALSLSRKATVTALVLSYVRRRRGAVHLDALVAAARAAVPPESAYRVASQWADKHGSPQLGLEETVERGVRMTVSSVASQLVAAGRLRRVCYQWYAKA